MAVRRILYPSVQAPPFVPAAAPTITVDRWYTQLSQPQFRKPTTALFAPASAFRSLTTPTIVSLATGALTVTGQAINLTTFVDVATGPLTITGPISISFPINVDVTTGNITIGGQAVAVPNTIPVATGAIVTTGNAISFPLQLSIATGALALSQLSLIVDIVSGVPIGTGSLTVAAPSGLLTASIPIGTGFISIGQQVTTPSNGVLLAAAGKPIPANDFNVVAAKVRNLYGTGSADRGYGQTAISLADVTAQTPVTTAQWTNIKNALAVVVAHQGGAAPNTPSVSVGVPIGSQDPGLFLTGAALADNVRLNVGAGNTGLIQNTYTNTRGSTWTTFSWNVDAVWLSEDAARFFWNSGGQIQIRMAHPNASDAQNIQWGTTLTSLVGTVSIKAHASTSTGNAGTASAAIGAYELTGSNQTLFTWTGVGGNIAGDSVLVQAQRLNFIGLNGGNGNGVRFLVTLTEGGGGSIQSGTNVAFDVLKAVDLLTPAIATPIVTIASGSNNINFVDIATRALTVAGQAVVFQNPNLLFSSSNFANTTDWMAHDGASYAGGVLTYGTTAAIGGLSQNMTGLLAQNMNYTASWYVDPNWVINQNIAASTNLSDATKWFTFGGATFVAAGTNGSDGKPEYTLTFNAARNGAFMPMAFTAGSTYTVQMKVRGNCAFQFNWWNGGGGPDIHSNTFTPTGSDQVYSFTWTPTATLDANFVSIGVVANNTGGTASGTLTVSDFKVENAPYASPVVDAVAINLLASGDLRSYGAFGGASVVLDTVQTGDGKPRYVATHPTGRNGLIAYMAFTSGTQYTAQIEASGNCPFQLNWWDGGTGSGDQHSSTFTPTGSAQTFTFTWTPTATIDPNAVSIAIVANNQGGVASGTNTYDKFKVAQEATASSYSDPGVGSSFPLIATTKKFRFNWFDGANNHFSGDRLPAASGENDYTFNSGPISGTPTFGIVSDVAGTTGALRTSKAKLEIGSSASQYTEGPSHTPPANSRNYLIGFYSNGSGVKANPGYNPFLGYHPEFTIDSAFQDHVAGGGFTASPDLLGYPVVIDVDIFNATHDLSVYSALANGTSFDANIRATFQSAVNRYGASKIVAVRVDSEWNLQDPWATVSAATYKAAFDKVVAIGKTLIPSTKYIFNVNTTHTGGGAIVNYIPTTADMIGVDAYSQPGSGIGTSTDTANFLLTADGCLNFWAQQGRNVGKPVGLCEWADCFGDGVYINTVKTWADTPANNVVLLCCWDSPDALSSSGALRGGSATAFQQGFGNRPYGGSFFSLPLPATTNLPGY